MTHMSPEKCCIRMNYLGFLGKVSILNFVVGESYENQLSDVNDKESMQLFLYKGRLCFTKRM